MCTGEPLGRRSANLGWGAPRGRRKGFEMTGDGGRGINCHRWKIPVCLLRICYFAKLEQTHNVAVSILLDRLYITFIDALLLTSLFTYSSSSVVSKFSHCCDAVSCDEGAATHALSCLCTHMSISPACIGFCGWFLLQQSREHLIRSSQERN